MTSLKWVSRGSDKHVELSGRTLEPQKQKNVDSTRALHIGLKSEISVLQNVSAGLSPLSVLCVGQML